MSVNRAMHQSRLGRENEPDPLRLEGPLEPLLTLEEVAAILRLSPRTIRRLVSSGKLPCAHLAGRLRFLAADVKGFVSSRLGRR